MSYDVYGRAVGMMHDRPDGDREGIEKRWDLDDDGRAIVHGASSGFLCLQTRISERYPILNLQAATEAIRLVSGSARDARRRTSKIFLRAIAMQDPNRNRIHSGYQYVLLNKRSRPAHEARNHRDFAENDLHNAAEKAAGLTAGLDDPKAAEESRSSLARAEFAQRTRDARLA